MVYNSLNSIDLTERVFKMKKILSIIMVAALILSLGSMLSVTTSAIPITLSTIVDGNSFATAKSMSVNTSYSDNITEDDDIDYYKFTLSDAGSVYINFKHENLFDSAEYWVATIYDTDTDEIAEYSFSGADTNVNTYKVGLDKGTYYLEIHGGCWYSGSRYSGRYDATNYTFNLKYTKSAYWEKENNEEFKTATRIYENKSYSGSINDDEDIDCYKLYIDSAGSMYINFKHENLFDSEEYWVATLYNTETEEIAEYSFLGADTNVNTYKLGLDKGTYYLEIHGGCWYSGSRYSGRYDATNYTFNLKYTKSAYWEKENNEEFKTATRIYENKSYSGSINDDEDIDYYKFNLYQKTNIRLNLNIKKQDSQEEYYVINLYDSETDEILSQSVYGNKSSTYVNTVLSSGTYYLEIHGGCWYGGSKYSGRFTTDTYTLKVEEMLPSTTKVTASQTTNTITLKWNKVSGATGYIVYKYNPSTKKYVNTAKVKTNSYKFKKLAAGTTYKFLVKAYKTKGSTTIYSGNTGISACTKPNTAKISSVSTTKKKATVKWKKVSGSTGYQIVYSTSKNFKSAKSAYVSSSKAYKTLSSLKSGKTYYFKVRAYKKVSGKTVYGAYSTVKSKKIK